MNVKRISKTLKPSDVKKNSKDVLQTAKGKVNDRKRLSSQEFLSLWNTIRTDGPKVQYPNPDNWNKQEK